jgi:predicted DNA-binding transcriptional regulator AlpA
MNGNRKQPTNQSSALTVDDLADRWSTTAAVIYGMRHKSQCPPAIRVGKQLRWRLEDVEQWETAHLEATTRPRARAT